MFQAVESPQHSIIKLLFFLIWKEYRFEKKTK